ncbi:MAG TPA: GNAT family N-acetyltransferase [Gaiellaceae bacterium]|nr:GNAT family N-acetyltransferase [Gaiellaceae bacterium]
MRELDAAAWDELTLDAYYRRPYVESAALLDKGRPFLLEHEGAVFAGIERDDPARDVVTPYGYGGPVGGGGGFWPAYEEWCRGRGVVSTFVRFHPLYGNQAGAPIHVEPLAPTVAWRLEPERDLLAGLHWKHRNKVRKAENAGATVSAAHGLGEFVPLYEDTMRRVNADDFYFFEPAYWERLAGLGEAILRFDAGIDGEVVASALCLASPPWLHYHLSGTTDAGRSTGASTLVLLEAARWAQERGYERFHLGGGLGGRQDSLHHFKARFDPEGLVEAAVGKAIHDEDAYRRLSAGEAGYQGFFPAYRAASG